MAVTMMFMPPILLVLALPTMAEPFNLKPYRAEYSGQYDGVPVKAKGIRELVRLDDGSYLLTSSAKAMLMNVTETSHFRSGADGIVPKTYHYKRNTFGRKKEEAVSFDWQAMIASHDASTSSLTEGTLDKLSYQTQLRLDVADRLVEENEEALTYTIADEEKRREYVFEFIGEEVLDTPLGELRTIAVQRYREDRDRRTTVWLALDHQLLMVRLKQEEPDGGFELNLEGFEMSPGVEVADN